MNKQEKKETYKEYAQKKAAKSPLIQDTLRAFFGGGMICLIGQGFAELYGALGASEDNAYLLASLSLIAIAVLLTALGVFDRIASFAGTGTLVPITGFANAMSSPVIDAKSEGFILGIGTKMFSIAGPVILYGTAAGMVYGVIYWVVTMLL